MRSLLLAFLLAFSGSAGAQINLYVDSSVSSSGAGTSWSAAFKTLSEALTLANGASTSSQYVISVAKGTYYPAGAATNTMRDSAFCIFRGGVRIYGGYPSGGGSRDRNLNRTILSGEIQTAAISDNSYHVMVISNVAASADSIVIEGFEFTGGNSDGQLTYQMNNKPIRRSTGGGVHITSVYRSCTIAECKFSGNRAVSQGGAIGADDAEINLLKCSFDDNHATGGNFGEGGAVCILGYGLGASIDSCQFDNNTCSYSGGGFFTSGTTKIRVTNSTFTNNSAGGRGGGACEFPVTPNTIGYWANCSFTNNRAQGTAFLTQGGGYYGGTLGGPQEMIGCRFIGNFAGDRAGGAYAFGTTVRNCLFESNSTNGEAGGAYLTDVDSCIFRKNKAGLTGGGVLLHQGSISNSSFMADTAGIGGGGIYTRLSCSVTRCRIEKNTAIFGGGIYAADGGSVTAFRQNIIRGNIAFLNGGGIYSRGVSFSASNCLFSGNEAVSLGGGIFDSSANPTITNCTLAADTATSGNGIYNTNSSPVIRNSILWDGPFGIYNFNGSTPAITYSVVSGGHLGTGNTSNDPLFLSPLPVSSVPDTGGNYDLAPCSPAVNTGSNVLSADPGDVLLRPRIFAATVDRGAFESQQLYPQQLPGAALCVNDTLRLLGTVPAGIWSSGNTAIASIDAGGLVTGIAPGTVTISQGSAACPQMATWTIIVNAVPVVAPISGRSRVCIDDTLRLSNASPGGTWTNSQAALGSVTQAGIYTANAAGTDTIYYTIVSAAGCRAASSAIITLDARPVVAAISGTNAICPRDTAILSNGTPGGVWSNSRSTIDSLSLTGIVTALSSGADTIFYTVTDAQGCATQVSLPFTVHPLPAVAPITGKTSLCLNDTTTLQNATSGGVWSNSNPAIINLSASGFSTAQGTGADTITYTVISPEGCANSAYQAVTVNAMPVISAIAGPDSVCMHSTPALSVTPSGGVWTSSDTGILSVNGAGNLIPVSEGTATVTYTVTAASGCSATVTKQVAVKDIDTSVTQTGLLFAASQNGAAYQWLDCSNGNVPISGATSQTFTATANGSYAVELQYNGCTIVSSCYMVQGLTAGSTLPRAGITVAPNPASGLVIVRIPDAAPADISVRDISGKLLHVQHSTGTDPTIDIQGWAPGLYFVEVHNAGGTFSTKLSVRR